MSGQCGKRKRHAHSATLTILVVCNFICRERKMVTAVVSLDSTSLISLETHKWSQEPARTTESLV